MAAVHRQRPEAGSVAPAVDCRERRWDKLVVLLAGRLQQNRQQTRQCRKVAFPSQVGMGLAGLAVGVTCRMAALVVVTGWIGLIHLDGVVVGTEGRGGACWLNQQWSRWQWRIWVGC